MAAPSRKQPTIYAHKSSKKTKPKQTKKKTVQSQASAKMGANCIKYNSSSVFKEAYNWLRSYNYSYLLSHYCFATSCSLWHRQVPAFGCNWFLGNVPRGSLPQGKSLNGINCFLPLSGSSKEQARTGLCRQHGTVAWQKHERQWEDYPLNNGAV